MEFKYKLLPLEIEVVVEEFDIKETGLDLYSEYWDYLVTNKDVHHYGELNMLKWFCKEITNGVYNK